MDRRFWPHITICFIKCRHFAMTLVTYIPAICTTHKYWHLYIVVFNFKFSGIEMSSLIVIINWDSIWQGCPTRPEHRQFKPAYAIASHNILWDAITSPCLRYLPLAKSPHIMSVYILHDENLEWAMIFVDVFSYAMYIGMQLKVFLLFHLNNRQ